MACRERLEAYLREHDVPFELEEHLVAFTAQKIAAAEHVPGRMVAKVVMVFADERVTMLVLPADHLVDLGQVTALLGAKDVRLAGEEEFRDFFPDCEPGAMPPFGNLYGLPVYVDSRLGANDRIVVQAGSHRETISLAYADFERLVKPVVADLAFGSGEPSAGAGAPPVSANR